MAASNYDYDVFINCPFDPEYRPLLHAVAFAVHDCGFRARSTLEIDDAGRVRIDNIYSLIRDCRFGIRDISRTEPDVAHGLPRFNMPSELDVFLGASKFGRGRQTEKRCLILDRERYRYQKFISDIAGQDIKSHNATPDSAIRMVRDWLDNALPESDVMRPGGRKIASRYEWFSDELPELCDVVHLDLDELTFNNFTTLLVEWLSLHEW